MAARGSGGLNAASALNSEPALPDPSRQSIGPLFAEHEHPAVRRRKDIKLIWRNQGGCFSAASRIRLGDAAGARVNGLHQSRILNGHVNHATRGIEERGVGRSGEWPFAAHLSADCIESY